MEWPITCFILLEHFLHCLWYYIGRIVEQTCDVIFVGKWTMAIKVKTNYFPSFFILFLMMVRTKKMSTSSNHIGTYMHYKENSIRQAFLPVVWHLEKPWSIEPPSDTHIRQRAERCLSEGNTMVYRNQNVVQHAETTTPQFYELLLQRVFNNTRLRKRCC